jgi:hypothetical protein
VGVSVAIELSTRDSWTFPRLVGNDPSVSVPEVVAVEKLAPHPEAIESGATIARSLAAETLVTVAVWQKPLEALAIIAANRRKRV